MTDRVLFIFEMIGIVACAASGALAGMHKHMDAFGVSFLAVISAMGGGILRDTLAGDTPGIFIKYFYASASVIGAVVSMAVWNTVGEKAAMLIGIAVILILRLCAAHFRWNLFKDRSQAEKTGSES